MYQGKLKVYTNAELSTYTHEQIAENSGLVFVYDRTQADVDRVKELYEKYINGTITESEKEEWKSGIKGALNASDLNRVEWNTAVIGDLMNIGVITKEWICGEILNINDFQRIRDNVQLLRESWFVLTTSPPTPTQPLNTYQKWNDLEKILHDVYYAYGRMMNSYDYCGTEVYAGEGVGII